jgi:hypothetical protein
MSNPRVQVRMDQAFFEALSAFAEEQECSVAIIMLRATKAYLSQHHRWQCKTSARANAHVRKGTKEEGSDCAAPPEETDDETGRRAARRGERGKEARPQ